MAAATRYLPSIWWKPLRCTLPCPQQTCLLRIQETLSSAPVGNVRPAQAFLMLCAPGASSVCTDAPRNVKDQGVRGMGDEAQNQLLPPIRSRRLDCCLPLSDQDAVHGFAEVYA